MDKDEKKMIEDMRAIIQREHSDCMSNLCENCEYYAMNYCGSVKKANALHNAGCRIIGEDEIGIKKSELARLKNLEINYEQVYEDYRKLEQELKSYRKEAKEAKEAAFNEGFDTGKNAVAKYYLGRAYRIITNLKEKVDDALKAIKDVAEEDGVELE